MITWIHYIIIYTALYITGRSPSVLTHSHCNADHSLSETEISFFCTGELELHWCLDDGRAAAAWCMHSCRIKEIARNIIISCIFASILRLSFLPYRSCWFEANACKELLLVAPCSAFCSCFVRECVHHQEIERPLTFSPTHSCASARYFKQHLKFEGPLPQMCGRTGSKLTTLTLASPLGGN